MKRNEWGDACYDESNVLYWVLISPDGVYDEEDEERDLRAASRAARDEEKKGGDRDER